MRGCVVCQQLFGEEGFAPTKSPFFPDGHITICNDCIDKLIEEHKWDWDYIDKLCQNIDVPFVPSQWVELENMGTANLFYRYASIFAESEYDNVGWKDYQNAYLKLKKEGRLEEELPLLSDKRRQELRERWGANYDDESLQYLENLYIGMMTTQNVNGALQKDQAEKICKISFEIDSRIRAGQDFDKLLASYDKLVKAAEFTPKNVKNINDFDTCGELIKWLEKKGWRNDYYDNVPRDVVDETIANIQAYNQRLYVNESGIGEEITKRLEALKQVEQLEKGDYYNTGSEINDLDFYENDGYEKLMQGMDEEFEA